MSDFYNKYPYTDFHEFNLDWVIERVKKLTEDWLATQEAWNNTQEQWQQLHDYVMDYFANLDVQDEINNKINAMILNGSFLTIVSPTINQTVVDATTSWLADHITQPTTPAIDTSLSIAGAAADSKTVGDLALLNIGYYSTAAQITASGYTDADNFPIGSVITLGSPNIGVSNLPNAGFCGTIITFGGNKSISAFLGQLAFRTTGNTSKDVFYRCMYSAWTDWVHIPQTGDQVVELKGYYSTAAQITASGYTDADNFPVGSVISLGAENIGVSNLPVNDFKGTIITLGGNNSYMDFNGQIAFYASGSMFAIYYRCRYSSYHPWIKLPTHATLELIGYYSTAAQITASGYTDADNFPVGSVITLGSPNIGVSNLPNAGFCGTIITFGGNNTISAFLGQLAFRTTGNTSMDVYYRCKYSAWTDWVHIPQTGDQVVELKGYYSTAAQITASGYTDADNFPVGSVISLGSPNIGVSNLPVIDFTGSILTVGGKNNITAFNGQIAFDSHSGSFDIYYRCRYSSYHAWTRLVKDSDIFYNNNAYRALKDFVACGDSLTKSLSYQQAGVDATVKSWAQYIAEDCNATCLIKAAGGLTTSAFLSSTLYTDAVADTKDVAIVFLGTNDLNQSVDIATFTTNYTTIINGLLTNHKFVLCISLINQLSASGRDAYNTAIEGICSTPGLNAFYVNANKYNRLLTGYTNWGHLSSFGYAALAEVITLGINDTIKANSSYFNYTYDFI